MSIIVCDGVSLSYGIDVILEKIDFSVNAGDKVGVIGVNGAGKSTLFSIIKGKLDTTKGDVYIHRARKSVFLSRLMMLTALIAVFMKRLFRLFLN